MAVGAGHECDGRDTRDAGLRPCDGGGGAPAPTNVFDRNRNRLATHDSSLCNFHQAPHQISATPIAIRPIWTLHHEPRSANSQL